MNTKYQPAHFWRPVNAIGKAASVWGVHKGESLLIKFYWPLEELIFRQDANLQRDIEEFLNQHPLVEPLKKHEIHLVNIYNEFYEAIDPRWVPAA